MATPHIANALRRALLIKVKMGLTTIEEALANVPPDLIL
jgi:hypothetical protein